MVQVSSQLSLQNLVSPEGVAEWLAALGFKSQDSAETNMIWRAFKLAEEAHTHQQRASGEPYINHSVAVADILVGLHLDPEAIAAAILHDVVEDTEISLVDITQQFGPVVARLVDGVTKMSLIDNQAVNLTGGGRKETHQAESLRKLLLAMAEDVRVVLIKLADRLHNMRTLKHLTEIKQRRIARETLDIYAPLANRLGIWQIKWELEDLSFRYMEPVKYKQIAQFLDERRIDREGYIEQGKQTLLRELGRMGIKSEVTGRPKHLYSIWRKMQRKHLGFHELYDVRALRIIVDEKRDCYTALGVVHSLWRHIPKEFDDYIATPKENNYQSIHTAVIGPGGKTLEVQIRTREMHEHAELGVAAHWRYKEGGKHDKGYEQKIVWLRQLLDWKDESVDAGDFIDRFKSEVFQDRVYVLTPQGDVVDLQQGATPLDFAYHIHTEVGHRCRGARINGRMVTLTYELKSGEQVEVLTTRHSRPSRDWLNVQLGYLKTSRARAKVRAWFKQQDQGISITSGRAALERELRRLGVAEVNHQTLAERLSFASVDDFLAALGRGDLTSTQIASVLQEIVTPIVETEPVLPAARSDTSPRDDIHIQGVGNLLTNMGKCCHPAPGDNIIGFITRGRGVTIHRRDCRNILKMDGTRRARLIDVDWTSSHRSNSYPVVILVDAIDRRNLLRDIITVLSTEDVNVTSVETKSIKTSNSARMRLTLEVNDIGQLSRVLNRISLVNNVMEVTRVDA